MKYKILTAMTFDKWLSKQKDRQAVRAIAMRIARAEQGNFGYTVVQLLNGGIKSNKKQQQEDIAKAKQILQKTRE